tara:strand:- start:538 stop:2025 length:1488 start_codon:yes stop_codon:yes gene_type:complete
MKKQIILLVILGLSYLFAKNEAQFLRQVEYEIEYEKIFKSQVTEYLEKFYDESDYFVLADVKLKVKSADTEEVNNNSNAQKTDRTNQLTFFEDIGLQPGPDLSGITPGPQKNKQSNSSSIYIDNNDYEIDKIRLSIYLAESIFSIESQQNITNFVNTNIDEIRNCFECFVLEKMPNPKGTGDIFTDERFQKLQDAYDQQAADIKSVLSTYEELRDSIKWSIFEEKQNDLKKELQAMIDQSAQDKKDLEAQLSASIEANQDKLEAQLSVKAKEIEFLERQLDEATSTREFLEDQEARRNELANNIDSLRFINLMNIEQEYRAKQNQLLDDITLDYERSVQARLDQAESTEERLFKLIESGGVTKKNEPNIVSNQSKGSNLILYIIIGVIALGFIILLIILLTRKKKVVYLKPKDSSNGTSSQPTPVNKEEEFKAPPTVSNENTDVVRAETHSLRQSAVTMSAGQKEGASQIISDWLDESSDSNDTDDNDNNAEEKE